jgi:hypothetical protein
LLEQDYLKPLRYLIIMTTCHDMAVRMTPHFVTRYTGLVWFCYVTEIR